MFRLRKPLLRIWFYATPKGEIVNRFVSTRVIQVLRGGGLLETYGDWPTACIKMQAVFFELVRRTSRRSYNFQKLISQNAQAKKTAMRRDLSGGGNGLISGELVQTS